MSPPSAISIAMLVGIYMSSFPVTVALFDVLPLSCVFGMGVGRDEDIAPPDSLSKRDGGFVKVPEAKDKGGTYSAYSGRVKAVDRRWRGGRPHPQGLAQYHTCYSL